MTWGSRRQWAGAWAMLPFGILLASTQVWVPPDRLPTHWSGVHPDGFASGGWVLVSALVVAGLSSVVAALVALVQVFVPGVWSRWIVTVLASVSGAAAAAYGVSAWATSLTGDPGDVHVVWAVLVAALALLSGFVAHQVHGLRVPPREDLLAGIPERSRVVPVSRAAVGDGTRGPAGDGAAAGGDGTGPAWTGRSASRLMVGLSVYSGVVFAVVIALLLLGGAAYRPLLVAAVVVGVPLTLFVVAWSRILVVVDARGLRVRCARLPVTLLALSSDQVLGVEVLDIDPMAWGGYGLRGTPGSTAYIVQGGDALVVHRASGRRLALECTEGEPREGAALLLQVAGQALAASRSGSAEG